MPTPDLEPFPEPKSEPWVVTTYREAPAAYRKPPAAHPLPPTGDEAGGPSLMIPGGIARLKAGPAFNPVELHHLYLQKPDLEALSAADSQLTAQLLELIDPHHLNEYTALCYMLIVQMSQIPLYPAGAGLADHRASTASCR